MVLVVLYESQALRKFATNKEFPREIFNATFLRLGLKNTCFVCIHSKKYFNLRKMVQNVYLRNKPEM